MTTNEFRNCHHVVYNLHAHIVLVPKYRRKVMTPRVTKLLGEVFGEVCRRYGATLDAYETDQDHVQWRAVSRAVLTAPINLPSRTVYRRA